MAGFGLNLKLVLYLQNQCVTESFEFTNPNFLKPKNVNPYLKISVLQVKKENILHPFQS